VTTTTVQPMFDEISAVVADWRPSQVESREAIRVAILRAAGDHKGLVHAAWVRTYLPTWVSPPQVGAVICALVRTGYLIPTGRSLPNGDPNPKARNRSKKSDVRRLTKPIPKEALR